MYSPVTGCRPIYCGVTLDSRATQPLLKTAWHGMLLWSVSHCGVLGYIMVGYGFDTHTNLYMENLLGTTILNITVSLACIGGFPWSGFSTMPDTANADSTMQQTILGETLLSLRSVPASLHRESSKDL